MRHRIGSAWTGILIAVAGVAGLSLAAGYWQLTRVRPALSQAYSAWAETAEAGAPRGAALFAFGDFGALDLDTLETSALPWPILAAALALKEAGGQAGLVEQKLVRKVLTGFGFLFPKS